MLLYEAIIFVEEFKYYCIRVSASYINTNKNKVTDNKFRKLKKILKWFLKLPIFDETTSVYGSVTIDLFYIINKCEI